MSGDGDDKNDKNDDKNDKNDGNSGDRAGRAGRAEHKRGGTNVCGLGSELCGVKNHVRHNGAIATA